MKLRIRGNSIRLRLTKTETEDLGTRGRVEEYVDFSDKDQPNFSYVLEKGSGPAVAASFDGRKITVSVPEEIADRWVRTDEIGIEGTDRGLHILVEKDFACLNPRRGEDESDNYPHPKLEETC